MGGMKGMIWHGLPGLSMSGVVDTIGQNGEGSSDAGFVIAETRRQKSRRACLAISRLSGTKLVPP